MMVPNHQCDTLLGFASKSKNLVAGKQNVLAALKKKQGHLLILAEDQNPKVISKWEYLAQSFSIPTIQYATKEHLGSVIGFSPRGSVLILDEGMARSIERIF